MYHDYVVYYYYHYRYRTLCLIYYRVVVKINLYQDSVKYIVPFVSNNVN